MKNKKKLTPGNQHVYKQAWQAKNSWFKSPWTTQAERQMLWVPVDRITTSHVFSCSVGLLSAGPGTDSSKANLSLRSVLRPSREWCPQERGTEQGQMGPKSKEIPAQVTIITGLWVHCQLEWQLMAQQLGQMAYLQPVMGSRPTSISLLPLERDRERKGSHGCQLVSVKGEEAPFLWKACLSACF